MLVDAFTNFDVAILSSPDFKEDSVREEIISPFLDALGYSASGLSLIVRSRTLTHPFVKIGSTSRPITIIPDYLLVVDGKPSWVLDAKAPGEYILGGHHVEQAYSYAIHPDVRAEVYALCNGRELAVFRVGEDGPILHCQLQDINRRWDRIYELLSPESFRDAHATRITRRRPAATTFDRDSVRPLREIQNLRKQSAKRHFGVHGYFTKQVWNVVQDYIQNFTAPGDTVLDPFGGSGVTATEAAVLGRKAIHVDINPHSVFLVRQLIAPTDITLLTHEYGEIATAFARNAPRHPVEIAEALKRYPYPRGVRLPRNSDVHYVEDLFTPKQLAQLAYLKHLILRVEDENARGTLLLMFSGLLNKINLTYHASAGRSAGRGDSGVYRYYRYRLAPDPPDLDILTYFASRLKKVVAGKRELASLLSPVERSGMQIVQGSATDLSMVPTDSVDYIYTDPPYGSKIPYLDLSVMWNAWLDLPVSESDRQAEAIEGGELNKSKGEYATLLTQSIEEMYRTLKFDRWMSFVFAHKDPAYWHLIVDSAEKAGFEYMGAVQQSNGKVSFKKHQNPFTVLSGQLIINFKKKRSPRSIMKVQMGADIASIVIETIESVIAQHDGATLEQINDDLIIRGLELGFLDILSREYKDLSPLLASQFDYDRATKRFHVRQDRRFQSHLDVRLRIKYFLLSFLRRCEREGTQPTFDEVVLHIMPLLKNGVTPERQTILNVLEELAEHHGSDRWKLVGLREQLDLNVG